MNIFENSSIELSVEEIREIIYIHEELCKKLLKLSSWTIEQEENYINYCNIIEDCNNTLENIQ